MKKIASVLLTIMISLSFTACNMTKESKYTTKKISTNEPSVYSTENMVDNNTIKNFDITFVEKDDLSTEIIKEKDENLSYTVYSYGGDVQIIIDGKTMSLTTALNENKITIDEILSKANSDVNEGIAIEGNYKDGGSQLYKYPSYSIIKFNDVDGKKDLYIGNSEMNINDLF